MTILVDPDPMPSPARPAGRARFGSSRGWGLRLRAWTAPGPARGGNGFLVPLMSTEQARRFGALAAVWLVMVGWFWLWWLDTAHVVSTWKFVATTLVLAWLFLLQVYFVAVLATAKVPDRARAMPVGLRVAMVVTKAPSEPFEVVERTLRAMLAQDVPHDTWLADEDPSPETLAWCRENNVYVSTRRGRKDYHRQEWPRRTRCKEGNLAFFYDHFGYREYDVVAQLDADHVPEPGYLREMVRPFADPAVGYVSAPSICDQNARESWSARGRLHAEAMLHGILQAGYTSGMAPLCIGSHYAVRTRALKDIGGLGPELAEDHSTSMLMNAAGWRGVHALDAIAHGDGPNTFPDLVTQEFQWSRSLATILVQYTPHYLRDLRPLLRFEFIFAQLWYPLFSLMMLVMFLMPIAALASNALWVDVGYPDFLLRFGAVTVAIVALVAWLRRQGWGRPARFSVMGWEAALFLFARWPWTLYGTIAGVLAGMFGWKTEFRVTPKGAAVASDAPLRVLVPYAVLSLASGLPLFLFEAPSVPGFHIFAGLNSLAYAILLLVILLRHRRDVGLRPVPVLSRPWLRRSALLGAAIAVAAVPVAGLALRVPSGLPALLAVG